MKEFNLSEKIEFNRLHPKDVKEFIEEVKYHLKHGLMVGNKTIRNDWEIIDKLAGDSLIELEGGNEDDRNKTSK